MSADSKTGLAPGDASEIEDVTRNAGHDAEGEMTIPVMHGKSLT
jgi:hypothetical protein